MRRVSANLSANLVGAIWVAACAVAFVPVYVHLLGIEAYGLIGFFSALQAWAVLADLGFSAALTRQMALVERTESDRMAARETLSTVAVVSAAVGGAIAAVMATCASWIATDWLTTVRLDVEDVEQSIALMGLIIGLRLVSSLYSGAMTGLRALVPLNVARAVFATAKGLAVVPVIWWAGPSVTWFFTVQLVLAVAELAVLRRMTIRCLPVPARPRIFVYTRLTSIGRFASGVLTITILALLLTQVDKLVLSAMLPLTSLGDYALAAAIAGTIAMAAGTVGPVAQAYLSTSIASGNTQATANGFLLFSEAAALLVIPASALICTFSDIALFAWTRDGELAARVSPVLSILSAGFGLNALLFVPYHRQLALGITRYAIAINALAVVVFLPSLVSLTQAYGAIGAALCWLLLNLGYFAIGLPWVFSRLFPTELGRWMAHSVVRPTLAVGIVTLTAAWLAPPAALASQAAAIVFLCAVWVGASCAALAAMPALRDRILSGLFFG